MVGTELVSKRAHGQMGLAPVWVLGEQRMRADLRVRNEDLLGMCWAHSLWAMGSHRRLLSRGVAFKGSTSVSSQSSPIMALN